ncbi:hypothetical protein WHR41_05006 [Cladosporium halotolerans]|uniref:CENP-V/GFA domain-containing protein n=1 Tax=Cladosporium halotolerans TaxID=1052096 RepID=A0AB34KPQ9_9PEZI
MVKGSCVCGEWTYQYEGDAVVATFFCHCVPCRKLAGINGSTNAVVSENQYKQLSGTDRTFVRKGDSGKDVTNHNCAKCGTIMWAKVESLAGVKIVKTGTIDDEEALNQAIPVQEIYCKDRPASTPAISGIEQKHAA